MANRTHSAGHFELVLDGRTLGRFDTLLAATGPGLPARPLQPQELNLLTTPRSAPASSSPRHFHGLASRISQGGHAGSSAGGPFVQPMHATRPTTASPQTIALRHGRGDALSLQGWSNSVMPRVLVLVALGPANQPVGRYNLENAWPVKWSVPQAAGGGDVVIEQIVITHEGLRRV